MDYCSMWLKLRTAARQIDVAKFKLKMERVRRGFGV